MAPAPTYLNLDSDNDGSLAMDDDDEYTPPTADAYPNATVEAVHAGLSIWLDAWKAALKRPDNYWQQHDNLTNGFQLLSRLANHLGVSEGTIVEYITPVMKDMYYRGWSQKIHQSPLVTAYRAYRHDEEPEDWHPADSDGPRGTRRAPRLKAATPGDWLKPLDALEVEKAKKGKGKQKQSVEVKPTKKGAATTAVIATTPAPKHASNAGPAPTAKDAHKEKTAGRGKKTTKPATDSSNGDDDAVNDPPCTRCAADSSLVCTIQPPAPPKKAGGKAVVLHVCGPCGKSKNKCSLVPPPAAAKGRAKSEARTNDKTIEDGPAGEGGISKATGRGKRKPTTVMVAAGAPGQQRKSSVVSK